MSDREGPEESVDVAIVGAGVAGCYLAYRLISAGGAARLRTVSLHEIADRVGGRLRSPAVATLGGERVDLGAMRLDPEVRLIFDLVSHLDLAGDLEPFHDRRPENLVYVGTSRQRFGQRAGGDPLTVAAERILPGFDELRRDHSAALKREDWSVAEAVADEYRDLKEAVRLQGAELKHIDLPTLLRFVMGESATKSIEAANGYSCDRAAGNASAWLDVLFHGRYDVTYQRLAGGFEQLASRLRHRFERSGGTVRLGSRLVGIARAAQATRRSGYELLFDDSRDGPRRIVARHVVLALPQSALRTLIAGNPLVRDGRFIAAVEAVRAVPAAKLFLIYPRAWWADLGIRRGRSTTDLPLRQTWYPGGDRQQEGPTPLLAAYPTGGSVGYWRRLARDGSRSVVAAAQAQLAAMHGLRHVPDPIESLWHDWSAPPWHGGWHVWREGAEPDSVIRFIRRPLGGERIFVASECWSHDHGSVQGAVAAAECVAQDCFGLPWPDWLRRGGVRLDRKSVV